MSSSGCSPGLLGAPLRLLRPVPVTPWITWDEELTYQEEHALLEPLPGELAEASQANEFLQRKQTPSWLGACKPAATQILASLHHAPFHAKNHGDHSSYLLRAKLPLSSSPSQEPARWGWTIGFSNREETITHSDASPQWLPMVGLVHTQACDYALNSQAPQASHCERGDRDPARHKVAAGARKTDKPYTGVLGIEESSP